VITDFDFTLTKYFSSINMRGTSCHGVIEDSEFLQSGYRTHAKSLFNYYYPIETSSKLTVTQKIPFMVEWVDEAHKIMVERSVYQSNSYFPYLFSFRSGLKKSHIKLAVSKALMSSPPTISLRSGVGDFFKLLEEHRVPLLVFSAGIGDVIEEVIDQQLGGRSPLMHIVSNHMIFHHDALVGFTKPSYHVFNKHASTALHTPFFRHHDIKHRSNLVLLGDSLGDVHMSEGLSVPPDSLLTIGFLNEKPERLPEYLKVYDVVVLGDPGFEFPLALLRQVLHEEA
jgi:cytosolic 5'-nucleotidase 3